MSRLSRWEEAAELSKGFRDLCTTKKGPFELEKKKKNEGTNEQNFFFLVEKQQPFLMGIFWSVAFKKERSICRGGGCWLLKMKKNVPSFPFFYSLKIVEVRKGDEKENG